jgi:hypothetical protein
MGAFLNGDVPSRIIAIEADDPGSATARTCAAITAVAPEPPLTLVAFGAAALLLPAVALAQRAAHRRVASYVLVDPDVPPVSDSWPDAPVTVFIDATAEASLLCRLRGWDIRPLDGLASWTPMHP